MFLSKLFKKKFKMNNNIMSDYDVEQIKLNDYTIETRKIILTNFKNYTKLKIFNCNYCNLTKLPDLPNSLQDLRCNNNNLTKLPNLPNSLIELYCSNNKLTELSDLPNSLNLLECSFNNLIYPNYRIETINEINEINSKNRIIKRMKLLNRILLLEHSAMITMNPQRIQRLLDNKEIDFYDGSFDTLTN